MDQQNNLLLNKKLLIAIAVALILGYAMGRYLTPTKIEIKKEVVTVEKKVVDTDELKRIELERNKTLRKVITEITKPDGTKEKVTRFTETTTTNKTTEQEKKTKELTEKQTKETETKLIENKKNDWSLSALAGPGTLSLNLSNNLIYGGHIQRNILGPISFGAWGLTNKTFGLSLGLSF